jgi:hypothetical protein
MGVVFFLCLKKPHFLNDEELEAERGESCGNQAILKIVSEAFKKGGAK